MPRRPLIAALVLASLAAAPRAHAGVDPEELYQSGLADMKAGNPAAACPKFAEARRLKPDSTAALQGLALCYDKLGKTASAWARYRELTVDLKAHGDADRSQAAAARAEELGKTLSTVLIRPESRDTPGLIIRLDKDEVPQAMLGTKMNVDPGAHALEATAPGYEVWQTTFTIGARNDAKEVLVPALVSQSVAPAPTPTWDPQRIAGVSVGAAGAVGVVVGSILGGVTLSKVSSLKSGGHCTADLSACDSTGLSLRQSALTLAHGSTVALAIGGGALAAGIVTFATAPARGGTAAPKSGARVVVGPVAGAALTGLLARGEW